MNEGQAALSEELRHYQSALGPQWVWDQADKVAALEKRLAQFYGLFSDYEQPCDGYEQAAAIWNQMTQRRAELEKQLADCERDTRRMSMTIDEQDTAIEELHKSHELASQAAIEAAARIAREYGEHIGKTKPSGPIQLKGNAAFEIAASIEALLEQKAMNVEELEQKVAALEKQLADLRDLARQDAARMGELEKQLAEAQAEIFLLRGLLRESDIKEKNAEKFSAQAAIEAAATRLETFGSMAINTADQNEMFNWAAARIRELRDTDHLAERIRQERLEEARIWNSIRITSLNLPRTAQLEAEERIRELERPAAPGREKI